MILNRHYRGADWQEAIQVCLGEMRSWCERRKGDIPDFQNLLYLASSSPTPVQNREGPQSLRSPALTVVLTCLVVWIRIHGLRFLKHTCEVTVQHILLCRVSTRHRDIFKLLREKGPNQTIIVPWDISVASDMMADVFRHTLVPPGMEAMVTMLVRCPCYECSVY